MKDLQYTGDEPKWQKIQLTEKIAGHNDENPWEDI
jgi:hypothetical protein